MAPEIPNIMFFESFPFDSSGDEESKQNTLDPKAIKKSTQYGIAEVVKNSFMKEKAMF